MGVMRSVQRSSLLLVGALLLVAAAVWLVSGAWGLERAGREGPVADPAFGVRSGEAGIPEDGPGGGGVSNDDGSSEAEVDEARVVVSPAEGPPRLRVVVRSAQDGRPIEGVVVLGVGYDTGQKLAGRTDAAGEAVFEPIVPGQYALHASKSRELVVVAEHGETIEEIEVVKRFEVLGRVVDVHGRPVPGASIWATDTEYAMAGSVVGATADAAGRFAWQSYEYGQWLFATAAGFVASPVYDFSARQEQGESFEVTITMARPDVAELRGVVVAATDGRPVEAARVVLRPAAPPRLDPEAEAGFFGPSGRMPPSLETLTDEFGRFAFTDLTAGNASLRVRAEGFGQHWQEVEVRAPTTPDLRLELGEPLALHGIVVDDAGAPVANALLRAGSMGGVDEALTRSKRDGRYRLAPLPRRQVHLLVSADGHRFWDDDVLVPEGQSEHEFRVVLEREYRLRGLLLDDGGAPLVGWYVNGPDRSRHFAQTDARGQFEIDAEEPPALHGMAPPAEEGKLGAPQSLTLDPEPDADGRYTWRAHAADAASARIRGQVVLDDAIADARLVLDLRGGQPLFMRGERLVLGESGIPGSFEVGPFPAGAFRVRIEGAEGETRVAMHDLGTIELKSGEVVDLGSIEVVPAARIDLQVLRPQGVHPDDLRMRLARLPEDRWIPFGLFRDGTPMDRPLVPGSYRLQVSGKGVVPVERRIELERGEVEVVAIALESARTLLLTAAGEQTSGAPPWLPISVFDPGDQSLRFTTIVSSQELLGEGAQLGLPDGVHRLVLGFGDSEPVRVHFVPGGDERAQFAVR